MIYTQFWFGRPDPKYRPIMVASKEAIEAAGHEYRLIHDDTPVRSQGEAAALKDRAVVRMAAEDPRLITFDADLLLTDIFIPPDDGRLYLEGGNHIGYVIVNGACDVFRRMLDTANVDTWKYGSFQKHFPRDAGVIPKATYRHFMMQVRHINPPVDKNSAEYTALARQLREAEDVVEDIKREIEGLATAQNVKRIIDERIQNKIREQNKEKNSYIKV